MYRSEIEDELVDAQGAIPTLTVTDNAEGDTIHQGVELGLDVHLLELEGSRNGILRWRNIWTFNDFRFNKDPVYGSNRLAGVPESIYVSELRFDHHQGWYASTNFRHVASGAYVDYANTFRSPGYELVGLTAGWQITPALKIFGSAENLFNEKYVSNVSTVSNFSVLAPFRRALFTPGEGRAVYLGVNYSF